MSENLVYEGPIRIYTANKEGKPYSYVPKHSSDGVAVPFSRISFTTSEGQTIYLADFSNHSREVGDGGTAKVAYSVKLDAFNQPELYNNAKQYQLEAIQATGATQMAQNSHPSTQGSIAPAPSSFEQEKNESIRRQTCIKAAAVQYGAYLGANKGSKWDFVEFERIFEGTHAVLDGKNELDQALDNAKKTLVDEVEMPGPDAKLDDKEPGDADIPW